MEANMKTTIFWNATPCILVVQRRFGRKYFLHLQGEKHYACYFLICLLGLLFDFEDASSTFFLNVGKVLQDHTVSNHKRFNPTLQSCSFPNTCVFYKNIIFTAILIISGNS